LNSVDQGSHQQISASFSSLEEIMDRAYERYSLELRSVQILYSKSGKHNATRQRTELPEQAILFTPVALFLKERNGKMLVLKASPISTSCSQWTSRFNSLNVWWTKMPVCPG